MWSVCTAASCRRSTAATVIFWLVVLLGNNLSTSYFIGGRARPRDHYSNIDVVQRSGTNEGDSSVEKRDGAAASGRGTCTCTCETKPVSSSSSDQHPPTSGIDHPVKPPEKVVPPAASLMRTATRPRHSSTAAAAAKTKQPQQPAQQHHAAGGSGIIKVPPMQDYGFDNAYEPTVDEQSSFMEPVPQPQPQQQQEETENAQQQQAEDEWEQERFPWKLLPDRMCFRDVCSGDRECCRRFNICDRSAHVCVDCWYGSSCRSERDCCLKYPYCQRDWRTDPDGTRHVIGGKCTNEL